MKICVKNVIPERIKEICIAYSEEMDYKNDL